MAKTRRLTEAERESAKEVLDSVRQQIATAASGDARLLWAVRRYVYIRLQHDERGNPAQRRTLKLKKWVAQKGKCAMCDGDLPDRGAELDRLDTMKSYTMDNTRLVCHDCHRADQEKKGFA